MSSAYFASGTKFGSSKSTPKNDGGKSQMTLAELDEDEDKASEIRKDTMGYLARIQETKADINLLIMKTNSYSRNTGVSYKEVVTPKAEGDEQAYSKSPFGKQLHISDYSYTVTPKSRKNERSRL